MSSHEYRQKTKVQPRYYPSRGSDRGSSHRLGESTSFSTQTHHRGGGEIQMLPRTSSYDRGYPPGRNYNNPPQPRYGKSSQPRYTKNRRKLDDDELSQFSGLSYATPVMSNRTSSQQMRKMKTRDSDAASDITPIISNREYGGRYYMEPNKSFSDVSEVATGLSKQLSQSDEICDDHQKNEIHINNRRSSVFSSLSSSGRASVENEREERFHRRNSRNSIFSVSSGTSLFSIPSGQIPVQLQSRESSSRNRLGLEPTSQSSENNSQASSRELYTNLERKNSNSSRSKTNEKINNDILKLRHEMEMDDKRSKDMLSGKCDYYQVLVPSILCSLFLVQLLLSSFSTLSCRYITCNIGFEPLNVNFQQSEIDFGFWSFYSQTGEGPMRCMRYPTDFAEMFIVEDSMWMASRTIGIINILVGSLVLLILATVVGQKVIQHYFEESLDFKVFIFIEKRWKDITLYCSVILLLWELVKFVFTNIEVCSKKKWMNGMGEMVAGRGCSISRGGICTIFAVLFDVIIILILAFSDRIDSKCPNSGQDSDVTPPTVDCDDSVTLTRMGQITKMPSARGSSRSLGKDKLSDSSSSDHSNRRLITEALVRELSGLGRDKLSDSSSIGSNRRLITEALVRELSGKGEDLLLHDRNLHTHPEQRSSPKSMPQSRKTNNAQIQSSNMSVFSARSRQRNRLGSSSYREVVQVDNEEDESNDSFDSDEEQVYPMQHVQRSSNSSHFDRNPHHPDTRTSIGYYSNLDESLGMPKF